MNRKTPRLLVIPLLIATMLLATVYWLVPTAKADTIEVCAACAVTSIQTAVSQASPGDTIELSGEIYQETVLITQSVTIVGTTAAQSIIDGNEAGSVITVTMGATMTLQNVTLRNGSADLDGGGLLNNGQADLDDVIISDNRAETGGGIANFGTINMNNVTILSNNALLEGGGIYNLGTIAMQNSVVQQNEAAFAGGGIYNEGTLQLQTVQIRQNEASDPDNVGGGGIYNVNLGSVTVEQNSVIADNDAAVGAGILNRETLLVMNSTISGNDAEIVGGGLINEGMLTFQKSDLLDNSAGSDGGGIFNTDTAVFENALVQGNMANATNGAGGAINNAGIFTISHSSLVGNSAYNGAAVHNLFGFVMENSTVSGNNAGNAGAGIHQDGVFVDLLHVTFYNNLAAGSGSAVYQIAGTITAVNTILARGTSSGAGACSGTISSGGGNVADDSTCALNGTNDLNNVVVNLAALNGNNVHIPALNSIVINNAVTSDCLDDDQLGAVRPFGNGCDSGALETAVFRISLPFVTK